ncbi:MAG: glycosyl transferase [Pseudonocardiales bacterium]|nr:glycosyl transferase [Pseudonocardiales bacterium]
MQGVLTELRKTFSNVVAVDDGSEDGSAAEIMKAGAVLVRHAVNLGAGAAMETGLAYALAQPGATYFVTFDADGQHQVHDAAAMVALLRTGEIDVALGSRFIESGEAQGIPRSRRLLLQAGRRFESMTSGVSLTDAHCGLRAFNRAFAQQIRLKLRGMAHASELLDVLKRSGLRYREVPVTVLYTAYSMKKGQKSINSVNIAMDVWLHQLFSRRAGR